VALTLTCQSGHEARFELGAVGSGASRLLPPFRCLTGPVRVSDSWVTSKQAVNFFPTWCAARSWVFQTVDASNDFGKDGYVDITDDDGRLTGELFSVQVKGGESWTAADGYRIPVGKHRDVWMYSAVPVIGVVHDPKDGGSGGPTSRRPCERIASSHPSMFLTARSSTRTNSSRHSLSPYGRPPGQDFRWHSAVTPMMSRKQPCGTASPLPAATSMPSLPCAGASSPSGRRDGWPDSSLSPSAPAS
jgi:hypothetical protein